MSAFDEAVDFPTARLSCPTCLGTGINVDMVRKEISWCAACAGTGWIQIRYAAGPHQGTHRPVEVHGVAEAL